MEDLLFDYLSRVRMGKVEMFENLAVAPLWTAATDASDYKTLQEALPQAWIAVTEVDRAGSVPELKVTNNSDTAVLLLDGEELEGAKQNRVINTSILLPKKSKTIIPVSCSEQGRWAYSSSAFHDSGTILAYKLRSTKTASVTRSLRKSRRYSSDQMTFWSGISQMMHSAKVSSPTGALKDVLKSQQRKIDEYVRAFKPQAHQNGLLVYLDGEVVGFDIVSNRAAFTKLWPRLLESYAFDACLTEERTYADPSPEKGIGFLREAVESSSDKYDAVGLGEDFRFRGKGIVGTALVYKNEVIHVSFLRLPDDGEDDRQPYCLSRQRFGRDRRAGSPDVSHSPDTTDDEWESVRDYMRDVLASEDL